MPTTSTPSSVDQTDQLAQNLPGLAAEPVIAAVEQGLLDFLSTPEQQILDGIPLQQHPGQPPADPEAPTDPGLANQIDPFQLISSLLGGLATLGDGKFDPTQILGGVPEAIDAITSLMRQARGSVAHDWQGASGAAADEKARLAVGKGADVATRADAVRDNVSTAASNVAQARTRMIEIADEYQAKMAAIDLSTPSGRAAAVAAANEATEESTAVMQELQATLGLQAQQVSDIAAPLQVTNATGAGGATTGGPSNPLMGLARLDPTGVLPTIIGDPRLTPQGLAGNFMDLLFAPQTLTELNQGMKETNSTMARTNTIMTDLGHSLGRANELIGGPGGTNEAIGLAIGAMEDAADAARYAGDAGYYAGDAAYYAGDAGYYAGDAGYYAGDAGYYAGDAGYYAGDAGYAAADAAYAAEAAMTGEGGVVDATRDATEATEDATVATENTGQEIGEFNDNYQEAKDAGEDFVDGVQDNLDPREWFD